MSRESFAAALLAAATALLLAGTARAQEEGQMPTMSPEQQAMIEAMERAGTPGPQHAELAKMAGAWSFEGTFWMMRDQPPMTFSGTVERTMIMDGRVLREDVSSTWMDQPFHGQGMTGYDNVTGKYWSSWIDTGTTGMMTSTGSCEAGKCEFTGTAVDPVTGEPYTMRTTGEIGPDSETWRGYESKNGVERQTMEITYTRAP